MTCVTFGKYHLENPKWHLNGIELPVSGQLNNLLAIIAIKYHSHQQMQLKAARKAFYALQGSGMCDNGVKPDVVTQLWNAIIQPILVHGTKYLLMNKTDITQIDKSQAKLLESAIGLHKYYRNSPLLNAMNVNKIPKLRDIFTLDLFRKAMYSQSQATAFYNFIINSGSYNNPCNLVSRVNTICHTNHVSLMQYYTESQRSMKIMYTHGTDDLTDNVRLLLKNYTYYDKEMLKLLLTPF